MMYGSDARLRQVGKWWDSIDEHNQTLTATYWDENSDEIQGDFHFKWVVCSLCDGRGVHTDPAVDAGGLTHQDFDDMGSQFTEDYHHGKFNVTCRRCEGKRVEPELLGDSVPTQRLRDHLRWRENDAAEQQREWEMGY